MPTSPINAVAVDLQCDEIIVGTPTFAVTVPSGVDSDMVPRSVAVIGVDGTTKSARGRGAFSWKPSATIEPGRHVLTVDALTDRKQQLVAEAVQIPFTVVASKARIPKNVRVESFSRVRLGADANERLATDRVPEGRFVDFVKGSTRDGDEPVELSFDQDGKRVDGEAMLAKNELARATKRGKIHPHLAAALASAKRGQKLTVDVWIDAAEPDLHTAERPMFDHDVAEMSKRATERRRSMREQVERVAEHIDGAMESVTVMAVDPAAPVMQVEVTASDLEELARQPEIAGLLLHETEGIEDLDDSIAIARSGVVHAAGEDGRGIRVAVWERGPTSTSDLVIAGRFSTNPSTSNHSQNVHAIIRNDEAGTPDGHAPGCDLYSANAFDRSALTWAVEDQDCTVVNQSFHRSSEPGSGDLSSDDLYGDWLALHWPYPLIVHAAGNFWSTDPDNISPPSSEFVNHKGFNTISVGNHNDAGTAMSSGSVFRNPNSSHGDRELPEISANGTSVTADNITMSGTSQASPAVAGVAALLQGTSSTLTHWPEGCRAILLASASRNLSGSTWWQDVSNNVDAGDGAGAVDASEGRAVALNRRSRNSSGTRRGWDIGLLASGDFGSNKLSTFDYKVAVPNHRFGPRRVKVALAWTSKVTNVPNLQYGSELEVDLDLKVYDSNDNQVAYSGSWDNSYEIAEFDARQGETYTIRIRRWSGTESTYYGIAWTVTGGFTFSVPFAAEQLGLVIG